MLLVRGGTAGFTIDQRSLSVIADAGATVNIAARSRHQHAVERTGADRRSGDHRHARYSSTAAALTSSPIGHVRIQGYAPGRDSTQHHPNGDAGDIGAYWPPVSSGLRLLQLRGGGGFEQVILGPNGRRRAGLSSQGSAVALYDCVLVGGKGGDADYIGGLSRGSGHGFVVYDYGILASGCPSPADWAVKFHAAVTVSS